MKRKKKYDIRSYRKQIFIGFTAIITILFTLMLSPVGVYALNNDQDIENNNSDLFDNSGTIINNYGKIQFNRGNITNNHGEINYNRECLIENNYANIVNLSGDIEHMHSGVITINAGADIYEFLGGEITNNFGTIHSMDPANATVVNNFGGYLPPGCEATNQYYELRFIPPSCGLDSKVNAVFTGFTESNDYNTGNTGGYGYLKHEESGTITLTAVDGYSLSGPEVTTPVSTGTYDYTVTKSGDSYVIGISNMTGNAKVFLGDLGLTLCQGGNPVKVLELNITTNADSFVVPGNDVVDISVISFSSTDNIIKSIEFNRWDTDLNSNTKFILYKKYRYFLEVTANGGYDLNDTVQYVRVDGELINCAYIYITSPEGISIGVMKYIYPVQSQHKGSAQKESSPPKSSLSDHVHSFSWEVTKYPTATSDGEEVHICSCGEVDERSILPAISAFEQETINLIKNAPTNGVVTVETKLFNSFGIGVRDALAARPDVTLKVSFLSEGYKGQPLKVTIPAGKENIKLWDEKGWLGLCRAGSTLGYDVID